MRILHSTLFLSFFLVPAAAIAGGYGGAEDTVRHIFASSDLDEDTVLTADEYEAAGLGQFGVTFEDSDLNGDGEVSFTEYLDLYRSHHAGGHGAEA